MKLISKKRTGTWELPYSYEYSQAEAPPGPGRFTFIQFLDFGNHHDLFETKHWVSPQQWSMQGTTAFHSLAWRRFAALSAPLAPTYFLARRIHIKALIFLFLFPVHTTRSRRAGTLRSESVPAIPGERPARALG